MPAVPALSRPRLKLAIVLGVASSAAALALFPYLVAAMPRLIARVPMRLPALMALQAVQSATLGTVLGWLGLWLGERHGLGAPWLRAWIYREPSPPRPGKWLAAALLGAVAGLIVVAATLHDPGTAQASTVTSLDLAWRGALASFYGGIAEEIQCRLFMMSLLVWLLARAAGGMARPWMFVASLFIAALLFGAAHLPAAFSAGFASSAADIPALLLLNMLVGAAAGWMFWKHGFEHAMVVHFSADLIIHGAGPLAQSALA